MRAPITISRFRYSLITEPELLALFDRLTFLEIADLMQATAAARTDSEYLELASAWVCRSGKNTANFTAPSGKPFGLS